MKILTNYDFNQNQILNATIQKLATPPATPAQGQIYFNTVSRRLFFYNGSSWIAADAGDAIESSHSHTNLTVLQAITASFTTELETKLNNIATNANNYSHPTGDGNLHVPTTGTNNSGKVLTAGASAGSITWQSPTITWANISSKPTSTTTAIDSAVTNSHTHSNKNILDSYTQTEANLADAVAKKHNHTNSTLLDSYTQSETNLADAVAKKHTQNTDTGTSSSTFQIGTSGGKLKNNAGSMQVRNAADNAFANLELQDITINGNLTSKGNLVIGDGTDTTTINNSKVTLKTSGKKGDASANTTNVFEIIDSNTTPEKLFEVRQNGDTVVGGVLTVNGAGNSTFTGNVNIGGNLNVDGTVTGGAKVNLGNDLDVVGNINVKGNTILGDDATADTTLINGVTTIKSSVTKAAGNATNDAFKVVDSSGAGLLQVKTNGDTVIGGVLTVNGTGQSTFAGDVSIGGNLTVSGNSTASANLAGNDLTLDGNLVVKGNTTLGDNVADTLNVVGTVTLPTTTTIGTVSHADLTNVKSKVHAQNTDTGTSSSTFQVGTTGVRMKNNSGTELQVRNSADSAFADLRVNNLIVEGNTTTINSNNVNIGDNKIELNSDITTNSTNSDGGIAIKRLASDNTTRKDAELNFNNSTGKWETIGGDVNATLVTAQIANKVAATIGNGTLTSYVITHNLNTRDLVVNIRETAGSYALVMTDVEMTTLNTITVKFAVAPALNEYTVTMIG